MVLNNYSLEKNRFKSLPIFKVRYDLNQQNLEPSDSYDTIVIHHTGSKDYTINGLIERHMGKLNYGAIAYHFAIGREGEIYCTRDLSFKGAHAYPNSGKIGIGFLRSFDNNRPNQDELASLSKMIGALKSMYPINSVVGHNQDQLNEIIKRSLQEDIDFSHDLISGLWTPKSKSSFDDAKTDLSKRVEGTKIENIVQGLKTCPGINLHEVFLLNER